jgi:uncharacterized protein YkwD
MRKLSVLFLPVACLLVISLSFYLLASPSLLPSVKKADAASKKVKSVRGINHHVTPRPTKELIPTPTNTPSPTPTLTPTPTKKPTPIPPNPTKVLTPAPIQSSSSDSVQSYIMQKINEYRASLGLSSVTIERNTCDFAKTRAQEITSSFNHDGFTNRINNHTLPYSSYHEVTENIAMTSDYKEVITMWINSPGHAENMRQDTPSVCVERSGNFYAYEGWRP